MKKRTSDCEDTELLRIPTDSSGESTGILNCSDGLTLNVLFLPPEYRSLRLYRPTLWKRIMYIGLSISTFGLLPLVTYYLPLLHAACTLSPLSSALFATVVLVHHMDTGVWESISLQREGENGTGLIWFEFRKHRYVYDDASGSFQRCSSTCHVLPVSSVKSRIDTGYSDSTAQHLLEYFGLNSLHIHVQPLHRVLIEKALHPFYVFQITSVFLWLHEEYYTYAILILAMSIGSLVYEAHTQVVNTTKMHNLVQMDRITVEVLRGGLALEVSAESLVVGDIVLVKMGTVPADMALLQGECAVDESSLTGEAIPVNKFSIPDDGVLDGELTKSKHRASVLHAGSVVGRLDVPCKGIVLATGFHTSKGELFRLIVCPKPIQFQVEKDSYRFMAALSILAVLTGLKNSYDAAIRGLGWARILVSWLDLITIAVPPALPLILTVGVGYSITRLQAAGIFCIDAPKINLAGHLNCFCFDKTGTLTSDHMIFEGVDIVEGDEFRGQRELNQSSEEMQHAAGSCHSVVLDQGMLVGSPLERSMLAASSHEWDTETNEIYCKSTNQRFKYVKKFAFDASVQRSSVVLSNGHVFVKGSPEAMAERCISMPSRYLDTVHEYAKAGYYCMGIGTKRISGSDELTRNEVESNLRFLGLLLFLNPIKPESTELMKALNTADIDVRIITGDNALTAIHVARSISMELKSNLAILDVNTGQPTTSDEQEQNAVIYNIDTGTKVPYSMDTFLQLSSSTDFAITGAALQWCQTSAVDVDLIDMIETTKIFARIRPDQKTFLVETLMAQGKYVGMCGDGTNDCGALKAAHVGLALSNAEASIVAPFTSRQQYILDVLTLIREGRCALTTSYLGFKYMVMYPVTQVIITSTLYSVLVTMSNNQFLLDDMVIVLGLSVTMLYTEPTHLLTSHQPAKTLFARSIVWSILGHIVIYLVSISWMWSYGSHQAWFCSVDDARANTTGCYKYVAPLGDGYTRVAYENSIIWLFGHWEFLIVAIAMNIKDPFRQSVWSNNHIFVGYSAFVCIVLLVLTLSNNSNLLGLFDLLVMPSAFRWHMLVIVLMNGISSIGWEYLVTRYFDKSNALQPTHLTAIHDIELVVYLKSMIAPSHCSPVFHLFYMLYTSYLRCHHKHIRRSTK